MSDASRVRAKTTATASKEAHFLDGTSRALCLSQANATADTSFSQLALTLDEQYSVFCAIKQILWKYEILESNINIENVQLNLKIFFLSCDVMEYFFSPNVWRVLEDSGNILRTAASVVQRPLFQRFFKDWRANIYGKIRSSDTTWHYQICVLMNCVEFSVYATHVIVYINKPNIYVFFNIQCDSSFLRCAHC